MRAFPYGSSLLLVACAIACSDASSSNETPPVGEEPGTDDGDAGDAGGLDARGDAHVNAGDAGDAGDAQAKPLAHVVQFDVGTGHACAVLGDGRLKCWGSNGYGQLGLGDTNDRGDGPGEMGDSLPAVDLGTGRKAVQVSIGDQRTCALLDDGSVKCWGDMGDGNRIGDAPGEMGNSLPALSLPNKAKQIVAGIAHHCVVLSDDTVHCWGNNGWGELGDGTTTSRQVSAQIPAVDLGSGRTVKSLALGTGHACAVLDDASLKCWGFNVDGELGLGDTDFHGDGPGEMGDSLPDVSLGPGRTALLVTASHVPIVASFPADRTCALLDNHTVKCWGDNGGDHKLGIGAAGDRGGQPGTMGNALPAIDLGSGRTAKMISSGGSFYGSGVTCAILDNDTVKCWGTNDHGELGLGDYSPHGGSAASMGDGLPAVNVGTSRKVKAVVVGSSYGDAVTPCVLVDDDRLKCWGNNAYGVIGAGDKTSRGALPSDMGDALPYVDLGH